jgi:hypothetical protein
MFNQIIFCSFRIYYFFSFIFSFDNISFVEA